MKKTTMILAAALALAACAKTDPAEEFRDALPKEQAVKVGTPQGDGPAGALSVRRDALGDSGILQSEYAVMSYYLAATLNGGVAWTLGLLHFVTTFPPTTISENAATWGPWVDNDGLNRWKLEAHKVGDSFAYTLSAQPGSNASAPYVALIDGTAYPADKDHGNGNFTVYFDAQDALDHATLWQKHDYGQVAVTYDNRSAVSVGAVFTNGRNADPQNPHDLNAAYSFLATPGGGELQIAFENLDTTETVSLRTRWLAPGAGRADAHYEGPGPVSYLASECWAGRAQGFVEVYDSKHTDVPGLDNENDCSPFLSAQYADIALP